MAVTPDLGSPAHEGIDPGAIVPVHLDKGFDWRQLILPVAPAGPQIALRIAPCSLPRQKFLMRWAGPSTRAFLCRLTPKRNSLSGLWPVRISDHSPFIFSSPRSRNCRNPRPCLIWPNTGSTAYIRKA